MVVYTLEQRWAKWACDRLTENADFGKKKLIFIGEPHFDLGLVCEKAKLSHLRHRKPSCIH